MSDPAETETLSTLEIIVEALKEKRGKDILTINLTHVENAICDCFVICHGTSTTQVDALAEAVQKEVKTKKGITPHHTEGSENSQWILIDYGDILAHLFLEDKRMFYNLEELWADGIVDRIADK